MAQPQQEKKPLPIAALTYARFYIVLFLRQTTSDLVADLNTDRLPETSVTSDAPQSSGLSSPTATRLQHKVPVSLEFI